MFTLKIDDVSYGVRFQYRPVRLVPGQRGANYFEELGIEGHPDDQNVKLAFEEIKFFTDLFDVLGVYPAADMRIAQKN